MKGEFDPDVADALRSLADGAPQPRPDRLLAVVAGVRRRQRRLAGASAVSVVALVIVTAVGLQSLRHSSAGDVTPPASSGSTSSSELPASSDGNPLDAAEAASSMPAASAVVPSAGTHPTSSATHVATATAGPPDPQLSLVASPTTLAAGEQVHFAVTVRNAGTGYFPPSQLGIGTMVPNDRFDSVPAGCALAVGGVSCAVPGLAPGQHVSYLFVVTVMPSPMGGDTMLATDNYSAPIGQPSSVSVSQDITVTGDYWPTSAPASPPASGAPNSASPTPSAGATSPSASASATSTTTQAAP